MPNAVSSTVPSQSLSIPSQISWLGPTNPMHVEHVCVPILHWLVPPYVKPPGVPGGTQATGGTLSTLPSQLLSVPSQTSAPGPTGPTHVHPVAPEHVNVPLLHGAVSVPLPLHVPPCGGHQLSVPNVQQLPGNVQQPFCPTGGASDN